MDQNRRVIEIFQQDMPGSGFETFKYKTPDGQEYVLTTKNRSISFERLKPFVGHKATLHIYFGSEYRYSEKIIIEGFIENPFGGEVPLFYFEDEE